MNQWITGLDHGIKGLMALNRRAIGVRSGLIAESTAQIVNLTAVIAGPSAQIVSLNRHSGQIDRI